MGPSPLISTQDIFQMVCVADIFLVLILILSWSLSKVIDGRYFQIVLIIS